MDSRENERFDYFLEKAREIKEIKKISLTDALLIMQLMELHDIESEIRDINQN